MYFQVEVTQPLRAIQGIGETKGNTYSLGESEWY